MRHIRQELALRFVCLAGLLGHFLSIFVGLGQTRIHLRQGSFRLLVAGDVDEKTADSHHVTIENNR